MTDYIEREAVLSAIWKTSAEHDLFFPAIILDAIKAIPAADVREVVRAAWQSWKQDKPPCKWYSCDYCGFHALSKSNFCPNCGARMEENNERN